MSRPVLEVADIFRDHGPAWRRATASHVSLDQLKVMSAIESCRTAALGGHVARCEDCAYTTIAYNSCRNRHCPKCQGAAAKEWLGSIHISQLARATQIPIAPAAPPYVPLSAVSLYGLCQGGISIGDRSAHLFSFVSFFVRSESPFLRPDPHFACAGARRSCQG
jgi:predicted Zn-ribbon and HTH transcriptional regulator